MSREDPELEALRQKRLQQLMSEQGLSSGTPEGVTPAQAQQQEEAKREADEQRQAMLRRILEPQAKERLSRVGLVKPEKAKQIEDMILLQARSGRLGKISEEILIEILEQVKEKSETRSSTVTFQRRRNILDDEDE